MPSYPPVGICISYKGFYIINLPSHLDHWQLTLYLRQRYERLSLTFYLSLTLQWGWCLTTQAETLFYHIVSVISVYSGSGDQIFLDGIKYFCVVRLTVTCALSEHRVTTAGRDHWAMLCGTPATGLLVSALRTLPPRGHCSCCSSSPLQYFLHRYSVLIIIDFFNSLLCWMFDI